MNAKTKHQHRVEERRRLIGICELAKQEIKEALRRGDYKRGDYRFATAALSQLFDATREASFLRVGGKTNFRGYLNFYIGITKKRPSLVP